MSGEKKSIRIDVTLFAIMTVFRSGGVNPVLRISQFLCITQSNLISEAQKREPITFFSLDGNNLATLANEWAKVLF